MKWTTDVIAGAPAGMVAPPKYPHLWFDRESKEVSVSSAGHASSPKPDTKSVEPASGQLAMACECRQYWVTVTVGEMPRRKGVCLLSMSSSAPARPLLPTFISCPASSTTSGKLWPSEGCRFKPRQGWGSVLLHPM